MIGFTPLHQNKFPKVSELISSDVNKLVSWFEQLVLLIVWNCTRCSLKKAWKVNSSKYWKETCFLGCQPHLEVAVSSLKVELPHTSHNQFDAELVQEISVNFLTTQFDLHQTLILILWILQYVSYWTAMFHISHPQISQTWKWLSWCCGIIWAKRWWRWHVLKINLTPLYSQILKSMFKDLRREERSLPGLFSFVLYA